jgi:hypothetical protein
VEVTLNKNKASRGLHLNCVDVSLDVKYCPITPVENMKEIDADYQRIDQVLKKRSVKISCCVADIIMPNASVFLIIHTLFQCEKRPHDLYPNGDN